MGTNAIFQSVGTFQVINATTTGTKSIGITGTMTDNGTTTVNMITNDTVQISAVVLQALTFAISSNSINFGTLGATAKYASSTNAVGDTADTVAHTITVSTNAPTGYSITVQGQTLTSQQNSANTITAIGTTPAVSAPTTEQFGIYATKAGGVNGTIDPTYATASSFGYDATATTSAIFASGTTPTNTETYSLHYIANIATLTEAGTYSANLVYVGTANF
jgi:RNase P/RNase MRP subunit p29